MRLVVMLCLTHKVLTGSPDAWLLLSMRWQLA